MTTAFQGTSRCNCHIYWWRASDKIVVSDIDGTITKSDVLGHVMPIIGRDWAQSGVASLFTKIVANNYRIVYLSARAIGQASITKDYLATVKQGDVNLPDGPLFLNPTSLVNAFHREVIEKKPEKFKIACLRDIQKLFPANPLYAGYGNRVNVSCEPILKPSKVSLTKLTCSGRLRLPHRRYPHFEDLHHQLEGRAATRADSDLPNIVSACPLPYHYIKIVFMSVEMLLYFMYVVW